MPHLNNVDDVERVDSSMCNCFIYSIVFVYVRMKNRFSGWSYKVRQYWKMLQTFLTTDKVWGKYVCRLLENRTPFYIKKLSIINLCYHHRHNLRGTNIMAGAFNKATLNFTSQFIIFKLNLFISLFSSAKTIRPKKKNKKCHWLIIAFFLSIEPLNLFVQYDVDEWSFHLATAPWRQSIARFLEPH